tara:strand:+ start:85 stop:225 length:141 start_codon:yes stop_codon:yes gene_type:complete
VSGFRGGSLVINSPAAIMTKPPMLEWKTTAAILYSIIYKFGNPEWG